MTDGLRDRIEAEATRRAMSFQDVVLECLLERFPEPVTTAPDMTKIMAALEAASSPEDFAAKAREANRLLEAGGSAYRVDMVPPFPGKITFSRAPKVPVPSEGETVILDGRTVKKRGQP